MKKIKPNWLIILILCILGFSVYNNYKQQKEIKSLEYEVTDLEDDKSRMQENIDSLNTALNECILEQGDNVNYSRTQSVIDTTSKDY